ADLLRASRPRGWWRQRAPRRAPLARRRAERGRLLGRYGRRRRRLGNRARPLCTRHAARRTRRACARRRLAARDPLADAEIRPGPRRRHRARRLVVDGGQLRVGRADGARVARPARVRRAASADRRCAGGGWNYGTVRVLDVDLAPLPQPTALAAIALAQEAAPRGMGRDLEVLAAFLDAPHGVFDLAAIALALDAWNS